MSSVIIISLGVVGLYVGRIFEQVKSRPLFVVDEVIEQDRPRTARESVAAAAVELPPMPPPP
jgi:hypothetical protein